MQRLYADQCQLCLYDPNPWYGLRLCHGHHIQWLSRGGEDELDNMVLACPNHHTAIHRDDVPFDCATLAFTFSRTPAQRLQLNEHLPRAA